MAQQRVSRKRVSQFISAKRRKMPLNSRQIAARECSGQGVCGIRSQKVIHGALYQRQQHALRVGLVETATRKHLHRNVEKRNHVTRSHYGCGVI